MSTSLPIKDNYTFKEVQDLVNNLTSIVRKQAPQESVDDLLSEVSKLTQSSVSFSEHAKASILQFAEGIVNYDRYPQYKKQFAEAIAKIVDKEEIRLKRSNKISFSEKTTTLPKLQSAVIRLNQALNYKK